MADCDLDQQSESLPNCARGPDTPLHVKQTQKGHKRKYWTVQNNKDVQSQEMYKIWNLCNVHRFNILYNLVFHMTYLVLHRFHILYIHVSCDCFEKVSYSVHILRLYAHVSLIVHLLRLCYTGFILCTYLAIVLHRFHILHISCFWYEIFWLSIEEKF